MRIVQINTVYKTGGSTGRIAYKINQIAAELGNETYAIYGYETSEMPADNSLRLQGRIRRKWNILKTRVWPHHGFYNVHETKQLIKFLDNFSPDIIHLHNIHNSYINVKMLFSYIKQHHIPVVWTLHDCWSFTGWCAYFDMANCFKWMEGCHGICPCKHDYPKTWFFNLGQQNWNDKRQVFTGCDNLTIVTPSKWLADHVKNSFLKSYPIRVINNGVDLSVFKQKSSNVRDKYGITKNVKIVLAVMNNWEKRKGISFLLELPKHLKPDQILIIVGLTDKQLKVLPNEHCLGIKRTESVSDLAGLYNEASVFINPTLEDNFPTTNLEALACGTPVVTFDTGGSAESIDAETGVVVKKRDFEHLFSSIQFVIEKGKAYYANSCIIRAQRLYDSYKQNLEYVKLYNEIIKNEAKNYDSYSLL